MKERSFSCMAAGALLFGLNICNAAPTSPRSPAAKAFELACLSAHKDCIYENVRFESIRSVFIEGHVYKILRNQHDIDTYNELLGSYLRPGAVQGLKSFSVERYNGDSNTWVAFRGTKTCKYCVTTNILVASHPELLRIDLTEQFARPDGYIVAGLAVYKDQKLKARVIVSAPRLFHPEDLSPIYIDSRIKGNHATTSFTKGGIILDLDGSEVPSALPDYVAISPMESWATVAAEFRRREASLVKDATGLAGATEGTPEQLLDRVAQQLQAYRIRYDAHMGGVFPSQSPDQVIASRHGDCKALATLTDALLRRVGISAHVVMLSEYSLPPLSFNVPGPFWNPLHIILYLPSVDMYIDPSRIAALGADWKTSAATYRGAIALDMATGRFVTIH